MSATLLPCPFCGFQYPILKSNGIGDYYISCETDDDEGGCGASTSDVRCESKQEAVQRWNRRAPTQPEVETVVWKDISTAPDVKGQYFFCRLAWGPDDDKTTADGFRWNGRWFAAPTFHVECSADGCQFQMRQVEVFPSHWMPRPPTPLSTQSPQPKEGQSHE